MSEPYATVAAVWVVLGLFAGVFCGIFADDILKTRLTIAAHIAFGVLAAVCAPLIAPVYLARGARDLHRAVYPKKVELPEARVRR